MKHGALPILAALAVLASAAAVGAPDRRLPEPAQVKVVVAPEAVPSGGEAQVTLYLEPKTGVKLNRYPKIKLSVPAQEQLAAKAEASIGSDAPPEDLTKNYFDAPQPLSLTLHMADSLSSGRHEIKGQLTYHYCMPASGFCAPARVALSIPVRVL